MRSAKEGVLDMLSDICIENRVFDAVRIELNHALQQTIKEMLCDRKSEGNVSLKLKVEIAGVLVTGDAIPRFTFKVSTNIPSKGQISGGLKGDYALCFEGDEVKINVASEQTSMLEKGSAEE